MNKFRLPKEFAEKWIAALRSGEYEQGRKELCSRDNEGKLHYCCLGVCLAELGGEPDDFKGEAYLYNLDYSRPLSKVPKEMNTIFQEVLAYLNDGPDEGEKEPADKYLGEAYRILKKENKERFSFEDIANWIEQNVELY